MYSPHDIHNHYLPSYAHKMTSLLTSALLTNLYSPLLGSTCYTMCWLENGHFNSGNYNWGLVNTYYLIS